MTQCEKIKSILSDYKWHHVLVIIENVKPGAVNLAVRSRISDLKKKLKVENKDIESRIAPDGQAEYRMVETGKREYTFVDTGNGIHKQGEMFQV